jgi:hypothetical protein
VNVSVGSFFLAGVPDFHDFNVKSKRFSRQRMIGIDVDIEPADLDYSDLYRPLMSLEGQ